MTLNKLFSLKRILQKAIKIAENNVQRKEVKKTLPETGLVYNQSTEHTFKSGPLTL